MASAMSFLATRPAVTITRPARAPRMVSRQAAGSDSYPEWGKNPFDDGYADAPWPNWADNKTGDEIAKWQEREIIHARWAMLGTAGAWSSEQGTGIPWFKAGEYCTAEDCTKLNSIFPGQVIGLAPEGSGLPSFYAVLGLEIVFVGLAEAYRTGLIDPVFPEFEVGDTHPGGRFDPLGLGSDPAKLEELKLKELKNGRLAMSAWLGYIVQAFVTNPGSDLPSYSDGAPGPYANWQAHVADPVGDNLWKYIGAFGK